MLDRDQIAAYYKANGLPEPYDNTARRKIVPEALERRVLEKFAYASSLFRNLALALAAGAVVLLYLQGGVAALIATSLLVEKEIRSLPEFSNGLVVGLAVSAVLMIGLQKRST